MNAAAGGHQRRNGFHSGLVLIFLLALVVLAACATPTAHVLQFEREYTNTSELSSTASTSSGQSTLWLGPKGVREDDGKRTDLFWPDRQQLARVDHRTRTYSLFDLPIELEALADNATRTRLEQFAHLVAARLDLSTAPEPREVGPWTAQGTFAQVVRAAGGAPVEIELWRTTELEIDVERLRAYQHAVAALDTMRRAWLPQLIDLDGVTVEYKEVRRQRMSTATSTRRLVSVEQQAAPADHFEIPPGYVQVPHDIGATFAIATPQPLPRAGDSGVE